MKDQILSQLLQNQLIRQKTLKFINKAYQILISNHHPSQKYQYEYYELTAALQALILQQVRVNNQRINNQRVDNQNANNLKKIIPQETFTIKWKDKFGVVCQKGQSFIIGSDITDRKITNQEHHIYLLGKLIQKKLNHVIQIQHFCHIQQKGQKLLQIVQEKGLAFEKQNTNYVKENIFFSTYTNEEQLNFLRDTFQAIVELNKNNINHNDITFRNFVFSIMYKCWKVIDFDISCNYQIFFKQFPSAKCYNQEKIRQSCPQTISSQGNYIRKNNELSSVCTLTAQQLTQLLKNYQNFYKQNNGKRDTIMYGLMILKLLFKIDLERLKTDNSFYCDINTIIQKLVRTYQIRYKSGNPIEQKQFQQTICHQNFKPKHFELVKFIFENMMTQSCRNRKRLDEVQAQWNEIIQKLSQYKEEQINPQKIQDKKVTKKQTLINNKSDYDQNSQYFIDKEEYIKTPYQSDLNCTQIKQNIIPIITKKKSSGIK